MSNQHVFMMNQNQYGNTPTPNLQSRPEDQIENRTYTNAASVSAPYH